VHGPNHQDFCTVTVYSPASSHGHSELTSMAHSPCLTIHSEEISLKTLPSTLQVRSQAHSGACSYGCSQLYSMVYSPCLTIDSQVSSQDAPKYTPSTLPSTAPSSFSSTLLNMFSRTLPIALDGTLPVYLALCSQRHSQEARHPQLHSMTNSQPTWLYTPRYTLKMQDTSNHT
jgi:hypothetical protein